MSEKTKHNFTEDEYFIMDTLRYVNAEKDNFTGVMLMLSSDKEQSNIHKSKMVKYLKHKGKYITEQDILKKAHQITRKREQYYRPEMYVKYIGETIEHLTKDKVYEVENVFGCDESFVLFGDNETIQEISAELVEWQDVTKIKYIGNEEDDGTVSVAEGFELNKTYNVEPFSMGQYKCENGLSCWFYEAYPIGFQKASACVPKSFKNFDEALRLLRDAIEFGDLKNLSYHLHSECKFTSQSSGNKLNTKIAFIKHFREIAQKQLECDVFCDCDFGTLEEVPENSRFPVGTRCIVSYGDDDYDIFLITLNEEHNYITNVDVFNKRYIQNNKYTIKADYQKAEDKSK